MTKITGSHLASLLALPLALTLASSPARAESPADVAAELARARGLQAQGNSKEACRAFQHADELAQGKSSPSLVGLAGCYSQIKQEDKAVAVARQAVAVAASPEERAEATNTLGFALLHLPDEPARTEALALFKEQADGSGGIQSQKGLLTALLSLQRDQEAADALQALRKEGMSENDIQEQILAGVNYPGPKDDTKQLDDFHERLHRLDPDAPLRVGGKVARPEVRSQVVPKTTAESRRHHGFSGTVIVETIIDTEGTVRNVRVLKGLPMGLTECAVNAVKAWTFKPATLDGKPVKVFYVLTVNFQIF
jgi:TonB family protein